jgi:soluble lytic murein transglycosylase-like protein
MLWILLVVLFASNLAPADTKFAVMEASLERQRSSIRKQVSASELEGAFFILPPPARLWRSTADPADCPALSEQELQPLVEEAARTSGLPPDRLGQLVRQKSGGRPCALSPSGAQGLMQLMPETLETTGVADGFDPRQNLQGGARLLKQLLDASQGDWDRALAAYNGPQNAPARLAGDPAPAAPAGPAAPQNPPVTADKKN